VARESLPAFSVSLAARRLFCVGQALLRVPRRV